MHTKSSCSLNLLWLGFTSMPVVVPFSGSWLTSKGLSVFVFVFQAASLFLAPCPTEPPCLSSARASTVTLWVKADMSAASFSFTRLSVSSADVSISFSLTKAWFPSAASAMKRKTWMKTMFLWAPPLLTLLWHRGMSANYNIFLLFQKKSVKP